MITGYFSIDSNKANLVECYPSCPMSKQIYVEHELTDNDLTSNGAANSMDEIVTILMQDRNNINKFNDTYQQEKHNDVSIPKEDDPRQPEENQHPDEEYNELQFGEMKN